MQTSARAAALNVPTREPESPQQRATVAIARMLLTRSPGERIPNVNDLRAEIGVGAGTVQKALVELQAHGLVTLNSKPRYGTYIVDWKLGGLWEAAALPGFTILLPLPNSWEFHGLASGLRVVLDALSMRSTFLFGHGSEQRAAALESGKAQVAVMSEHAAEVVSAPGSGLRVQHSLGPGTYYAPDSVVVLARTPRSDTGQNPRIGIDRSSDDHVALTQREFPGATYVDVSYSHIPTALTRGHIDAAVWHRTALGLSLADQELVTWTPISASITDSGGADLSAAALVVNDSDPFTQSVLRAAALDDVVAVQQAVVRGDALPTY